MKANHYIVKGIVQGVNFRYYTLKEAQKLGIKGNVKNLFNGDVEVYAQGEDDIMQEFEIYLHQGPISARVDRIIKEELSDPQSYLNFEIQY